MALEIALDTRRIADFGIGTYIRNLVRALARVDSENQYTLITTERPAPEFSDLPSNFRTAIFQGKNQTGLAQISYGLFLKKLNADVYHIPLNAVPLMARQRATPFRSPALERWSPPQCTPRCASIQRPSLRGLMTPRSPAISSSTSRSSG